jgi:hypothetical protein
MGQDWERKASVLIFFFFFLFFFLRGAQWTGGRIRSTPRRTGLIPRLMCHA